MYETVLAELQRNMRTKHLPADQLRELARDIYNQLIAEWVVVARHDKKVIVH